MSSVVFSLVGGCFLEKSISRGQNQFQPVFRAQNSIFENSLTFISEVLYVKIRKGTESGSVSQQENLNKEPFSSGIGYATERVLFCFETNMGSSNSESEQPTVRSNEKMYGPLTESRQLSSAVR